MVKALRLKIIVGLALALVAGSVSAAERPQVQARQVRVAIIDDIASIRLKIKGYYEIIDPATGKVLYQGRNIRTTVMGYKDGILLAGRGFSLRRILIKADDPEAFLIDDRNFRGNTEIIKNNLGHLLLVNHIDLEDYIKGILYHEASHYWPEEALKAQAVACRTYALYEMQENSKRDYDLTSDIYSQVYGGKFSERYRTNKAVDDTAGEVLYYKGKIFPTYYHATCAGYTEDAGELWNINLAPLKGVACGFCKDSPHYRWHNVISTEEFLEKLQGAGYKIKNIKDVIPVDKDKSGRYRSLKVVSGIGSTDISVKDLRNIVGPNIIKSAIFEVKIAAGDIVFEGLGWGHGVGLCQWGAYFMAKQGHAYQEILKYYYPESNVATF